MTVKKNQRSASFVAFLSLTTLGIYPIMWMGQTWSELKRELGDDSMRPFWHALSVLVPIYGLFRIHAHFRTINIALSRTDSRTEVNPGTVIKAVIVSAVAGNFASGIAPEFGVIALIVQLIVTAVAVSHGQSGMNAYWECKAIPETAAI